MKKIIFLAIGVFLIGAFIYGTIKTYTPTRPLVPNPPMTRTLGIYVDEEPKNPQNLKKIKIATITVAPDGNLALNILQKDNLQIQQLQDAFATIAAKPALTLTGENERVIDGQKVLAMEAWQVKKGESNYVYALIDTLATEFGFKAELEKETSPFIPEDNATATELLLIK